MLSLVVGPGGGVHAFGLVPLGVAVPPAIQAAGHHQGGRLPVGVGLLFAPHGLLQRPQLPTLYTGWNTRNFQELQADHNAYVQLLLALLGPNARPMPQFANLEAPNALAFAQMAQTIEDTGFRASEGAAPYFYDKGLLAQASQIAFAEAEHAGYLNTMLNSPITGNGSPLATPLTVDEVNARIQPFLVSLNGGPPPGFSMQPSPANDIAILNTALLLEYLAADFYNINLPRFSGVLG